MNFAKISTATIAALMAASTVHASVSDDFNRPDALTLGPNWTTQAGTVGIMNSQAFGYGLSYASYNGASSNFVSFDISLVGGGTSYIAGMLGLGGVDNAFIKVQNNGGLSRQFDSYAFYTNNNGNGTFATLTSPFDTAHVEISMVGYLATLKITPNVGGVQTYTHSYVLSGTGVGLGFYGDARADNFSTAAGLSTVPEPAAWGLMLIGFGLAGFAVRGRSMHFSS